MDILFHSGTPHEGQTPHSGRYAFGSGDSPYQHRESVMAQYYAMKKDGMSDADIVSALGISSTKLRNMKTVTKAESDAAIFRKVQHYMDHGDRTIDIARKMGVNESTVRSWKRRMEKDNQKSIYNVAQILKDSVDKNGTIDIGAGVEYDVGVARTKFKASVEYLQEKGYNVYKYEIPQATNPSQKTTIMALARPEKSWGEVREEIYNEGKLGSLGGLSAYTKDGGETITYFQFPQYIDRKRVMVRYAEDGGEERDGTIEIRRNVEDVSLGKSAYAQVRIAVEGDRYMKGMAFYGKDSEFPDGIDIIYNSNKKIGTSDEDVFKPMKRVNDKDPNSPIDISNPFGATIKEIGGQRYYDDPNGKFINPETGNKGSLAVVNKIKDEGEWADYDRTLASQFLSKQSLSLIKRQLNLSYADKKAEYDEIMTLTNPTVKKNLLESFAEDCDSAAVHLKAAALPRQAFQVIMPDPKLKDTEIYAPNFRDGEQVALVRYPHGGTFEIPILTVNNKAKSSIEIIGRDRSDAICINSKVAAKLSGADFDGDTALVIPTNSKVRIKSSELKDLEGFNPKIYKFSKEQVEKDPSIVISSDMKQTEMGKVTNLISDMTLMGADSHEIARAVKHSMVIIDSEKHQLDYKQSYADNRIAELKEKYQGGENKGSATIISRAKSPKMVDERKEGVIVEDPVTGTKKRMYVDPNTGEKLYTPTGRTYTKEETRTYKDGSTKTVVKVEKAQIESTKMYETKDAMDLVSSYRTPQEIEYAVYANRLKALANSARKESISVKKPKIDKEAKGEYANERASLIAKLGSAEKNSPKERQAQIATRAAMSQKIKANPNLKDDKDKRKKLTNQTLISYRNRVGAKRTAIDITEKEWEAIQAGAIGTSTLERIMKYADMEKVRQYAMPRQTTTISEAKQNQIRAMKNSGYTNAEIADHLGLSTTTVSKYKD